MPLDEILVARLEKLEKLKKAGIDPYPAKSWRTHTIGDVLEDFEGLMADKKFLVLAGRVLAVRGHGGSTFLNIDDGSGSVQVYFKKDLVGDREYNFFIETIDIGDFLEVSGSLFLTKKSERTLQVEKYRLLTKALLPLPEKWHGLQDVEDRFRKRYLDLIFNPEVKEKFLLRFKIIDLVRQFFKENNYLEVETPILQPLPGGATARPFKTHMNDLDIDLYLRVAPELYLKRLLVGGLERIFEIGKNFRNEGMDKEHNPEFTMLEAYAAYQDYEWLMKLTENLFEFLTMELYGQTSIKYDGNTINFRKPFARMEFNDVVKKYSGLDYEHADEEAFRGKAQELGMQIDKAMTKGNIADEIFKKLARHEMIDPVFVINHPIDLSPLSKKLSSESENVARFQLLVGGTEMANAFSELNDPIDQLERFENQEKMHEKGNEEAQRLDEEFIEALEHGMPPAAGIGIGIDRLVALLTDSRSLREILLFPTMKPRG
ncbi:MAG: lysine--tRNA ligase [Patescibacteria group bacterium]